MEMLSGAEMVVQSLVDQGVKQVFGYPGGAVLDIYDALHTLGGIDHVLVRHEQAAVHMADGLARATGEVGVVLVTSGRGDERHHRYCDGLYGLYSAGDPLRAGGDLAYRLRCLPGVRHGGDFPTGGEAQFPGEADRRYSRRAEESLLAGGQRSSRSGGGRSAERYSQSGEKLPYVWPDTVSMRSYNPTTSGHKGQIKRALQTLVAAKNRSSTSAAGRSMRNVNHSCANWWKN
jgi:acetolactate synthase-1/2/3 large subunit